MPATQRLASPTRSSTPWRSSLGNLALGTWPGGIGENLGSLARSAEVALGSRTHKARLLLQMVSQGEVCAGGA
eukprot:6814676-Alexandrium_andersonii.AAC.1